MPTTGTNGQFFYVLYDDADNGTIGGCISKCRPRRLGNLNRPAMEWPGYAQNTAGQCVARAFDARAIGT